jgi:Kef-type K+ transport system membrane component KefB
MGTTTTVQGAETLLYFVLLQLVVIVLAGRLGGVLARRFGQAVAAGEIIMGVLLGPSLFGWLFPGAFGYVFHSTPPQSLYILSQVGLILLMFNIGMEFDFSHLRENRIRRQVLWVAVAGLLAPFALGLGLGYYSAAILSPGINPLLCGLFVATAFCITALPILGRIMIEFNITRHPLGVIAISAAAINDLGGWLLLAVVTAITVAGFDPAGFGLRVGAIVLFGALAWLVLRPLLKKAVQRLGGPAGGPAMLSDSLLTVLLVTVFLTAICTNQLGIFSIFGAFLAGVLLHDETALVQAWKERVGRFVGVFFLPIFFTYTGLRTDISGLDTWALWGWCMLILALATLGKYGATYVAARCTGMNRHESSVLGAMMNTRGLMELIVLNVGLDLGVISRPVFTMLVVMAVVSTVITTPVLRYQLPHIAGTGR